MFNAVQAKNQIYQILMLRNQLRDAIDSLVTQNMLLHAIKAKVEQQLLEHGCIRVIDFTSCCWLIGSQQLAAS